MALHSYQTMTRRCLQGIPEALKTLDDLATSIGALVSPPEFQIHKKSNDDDKTGSDHASGNARNVVRLVLGSEDCASYNPTNTTSADEGSGAESALPLAADVVGLPRKDCGDVGVGCCGCEEDTSITDGYAVGETNHGEADESQHAIGDDPRTSDMV